MSFILITNKTGVDKTLWKVLSKNRKRELFLMEKLIQLTTNQRKKKKQKTKNRKEQEKR